MACLRYLTARTAKQTGTALLQAALRGFEYILGGALQKHGDRVNIAALCCAYLSLATAQIHARIAGENAHRDHASSD